MATLDGETKDDEDGEKPKPAGGTAGGAVDAQADSEQLAKGMADVRSLLQRTATAIAAAAAAVLTGLGYTQLHEIFPVPANAGLLSIALLVASLLAAMIGSVWLAARFFRAQRRILVASAIDQATDLGAEKELAQRVMAEHAAEEGAGSLQALEQRALRLDRIARTAKATDEVEAKALAAEAGRLNGVVAIALDRAAATVLEARSRKVFSSRWTIVPLLLAAAGIVGVFAVADHYKGERGLFEQRHKCLKAEDDGVLDACAALLTSEESDAQALKKQSQDAAAEVTKAEKAKAAGTATPAQQALLDRYAACQVEVARRVKAGKLPPDSKADAARLCAAAE